MKGKIQAVDIPVERLKEVMDYNPETGEFKWKINVSKNVKAGMKVGGRKGYFSVDKKGTTLRRAAWCFMTGEWPTLRVGYKNKDQADLRFCNLFLMEGLEGFDHSDPESRKAYHKMRRETFAPRWSDANLRREFGIGLAEYTKFVEEQDNRCAICRQPEMHMRNGRYKALAIDHCHETGKVRGLLCCDCNTAIGKLKDDPYVMIRAAEYILRSKSNSGDDSSQNSNPGSQALQTGPADAAQIVGRNLVQEEGT